MLFCSGVFGWKWMLKPPNSRFATLKYVVWILTFKDSWKGCLQLGQYTQPEMITESLHKHNISSVPHKLGVKPDRCETV